MANIGKAFRELGAGVATGIRDQSIYDEKKRADALAEAWRNAHFNLQKEQIEYGRGRDEVMDARYAEEQRIAAEGRDRAILESDRAHKLAERKQTFAEKQAEADRIAAQQEAAGEDALPEWWDLPADVRETAFGIAGTNTIEVPSLYGPDGSATTRIVDLSDMQVQAAHAAVAGGYNAIRASGKRTLYLDDAARIEKTIAAQIQDPEVRKAVVGRVLQGIMSTGTITLAPEVNGVRVEERAKDPDIKPYGSRGDEGQSPTARGEPQAAAAGVPPVGQGGGPADSPGAGAVAPRGTTTPLPDDTVTVEPTMGDRAGRARDWLLTRPETAPIPNYRPGTQVRGPGRGESAGRAGRAPIVDEEPPPQGLPPVRKNPLYTRAAEEGATEFEGAMVDLDQPRQTRGPGAAARGPAARGGAAGTIPARGPEGRMRGPGTGRQPRPDQIARQDPQLYERVKRMAERKFGPGVTVEQLWPTFESKTTLKAGFVDKKGKKAGSMYVPTHKGEAEALNSFAHEGLHFLVNAGAITPEDLAVLTEKSVEKWIDEYDIVERYGGPSTEEGIAWALGARMVERMEAEAKGTRPAAGDQADAIIDESIDFFEERAGGDTWGLLNAADAAANEPRDAKAILDAILDGEMRVETPPTEFEDTSRRLSDIVLSTPQSDLASTANITNTLLARRSLQWMLAQPDIGKDVDAWLRPKLEGVKGSARHAGFARSLVRDFSSDIYESGAPHHDWFTAYESR